MVERHLAKVEVAGSSPVIRSKTKTVPNVVRFFCSGDRITGLHRTKAVLSLKQQIATKRFVRDVFRMFACGEIRKLCEYFCTKAKILSVIPLQ